MEVDGAGNMRSSAPILHSDRRCARLLPDEGAFLGHACRRAVDVRRCGRCVSRRAVSLRVMDTGDPTRDMRHSPTCGMS